MYQDRQTRKVSYGAAVIKIDSKKTEKYNLKLIYLNDISFRGLSHFGRFLLLRKKWYLWTVNIESVGEKRDAYLYVNLCKQMLVDLSLRGRSRMPTGQKKVGFLNTYNHRQCSNGGRARVIWINGLSKLDCILYARPGVRNSIFNLLSTRNQHVRMLRLNNKG